MEGRDPLLSKDSAFSAKNKRSARVKILSDWGAYPLFFLSRHGKNQQSASKILTSPRLLC
jgi:hypothetical protein